MIERTKSQELFEIAIIAGILMVTLVFFSFEMGIIKLPEPQKEHVIITMEPTPIPTIEVTTIPTPAAIPTFEIEYVDPYQEGMRNENQWFKWYRPDVQGLKDLDMGIVVYRHRFLDRYTWWNSAQGNYFTQRPAPDTRFFVVWIHEEMFGVNQTDDPRIWGFDEDSFRLQVKDQLYDSETNRTYLPVIRIKEFDYLSNYYDTVTAGPFGYQVGWTGNNVKTGGFDAIPLGYVRMGKENGFDGYIIFQIPKDTMIEDIQLNGAFSRFGSAQWRFN